MKEAEPASETLCVVKLIDEGKCPRIYMSLKTHLQQKPLDRKDLSSYCIIRIPAQYCTLSSSSGLRNTCAIRIRLDNASKFRSLVP
jgi:hypothetical protein